MGPDSFPESSVCKESACDAGDPSSIFGLRRSPGEGIGYPLQYSWASLVAQMEKNLPAMWENWVPSLGWEDPLEKAMATHSSMLAWGIPWIEEPAWLQSMGSQRVRHGWATNTLHCRGVWMQRRDTFVQMIYCKRTENTKSTRISNVNWKDGKSIWYCLDVVKRNFKSKDQSLIPASPIDLFDPGKINYLCSLFSI